VATTMPAIVQCPVQSNTLQHNSLLWHLCNGFSFKLHHHSHTVTFHLDILDSVALFLTYFGVFRAIYEVTFTINFVYIYSQAAARSTPDQIALWVAILRALAPILGRWL